MQAINYVRSAFPEGLTSAARRADVAASHIFLQHSSSDPDAALGAREGQRVSRLGPLLTPSLSWPWYAVCDTIIFFSD